MPSPGQLSNPFPGLRPFRSEEDYLFFGREEQVSELLNRLGNHRFVAVVGSSGSGKSSLVRCGLLSELQGGRLVKAGSDWEFAVMQPGGDPVAHLAESLLEAGLYEEGDTDTMPRIQATLRRSRFGLVEAIKQSLMESGTNLLLVVDQFEEIFRFHQAGREGREEAPDFIRLLLEAAASPDVPIYIVLTMRSDFLGDCSRFTGLAEAVNDGEYLIPRLTRDQTQSAIEGPVRVAGGQISRRLIQRLLNDLEEDADQLPILQHCLMRMWDQWQMDRQDNEPIDLRQYQDIGGMDEALSRHADEVLQSLPTEDLRSLAVRVFQALTEKRVDGRGIRRPKRMQELVSITGADSEEIETLVNAYRQPGVTFLMPPGEISLQPATVIDISHESLMRVWTRLRHWVEEEEQSAGIFRRLTQTAALWKDGQAGLYHDPDLTIALGWKTSIHPTDAWARQYGGQFEQAMAFLDASQEADEAEEKAREQARQRELEQARALAEAERQQLVIQRRAAKRLKSLVGGLAVVALLAAAAWFSALQARKEAVANAELASLNEKVAQKAQQEATQAAAMLQETLVKNDFNLAVQRAQDGMASEELAYLSRALTVDPTFWKAGVRALSTLTSGRFADTQPVRIAQEKVITSYEFNPQEDLLWTGDRTQETQNSPEYVVWDVRTGKRLYTVGDKETFIQPKWTDDGQRLVLSIWKDKSVQVLDARTGVEISRITEPGLRREVPRLSRNAEQGRRIVVRNDAREVRVFDLDSGKPVTPPLQVTNNPGLIDFGFTADDKRVFIEANDGSINLYETDGGDLVTRITMSTNRFNYSRRTASGDIVLARATDNHRINWWHVAKGRDPGNPPWIEFEEKVERVRFVPGEPRVAVILSFTNAPSADKASQRAVIFDLDSRKEISRIELGPAAGVVYPPVDATTQNLAFPIIASMEENKVRVWDLVTGDRISEIVSGDLLREIMFSPEGRRLVTLSASHEVQCWDLFSSNSKWEKPIQHESRVLRWYFSPDGEKFYTVEQNSSMFRIMDARSGELLFEPISIKSFGTLLFSSQGNQVLLHLSYGVMAGATRETTVGEFLRLNLPYRPLIAEHLQEAGGNSAGTACFTPDGQRIVVLGRNLPSEPYQIKVLDAASHELLKSIPLPQGVEGMFLDGENYISSAGDKVLVHCSDRKSRIWNLQTGQLLHTLPHQEPVLYATWDRSASQVAMSGPGWTQVWDGDTGRPHFEPVKEGNDFLRWPQFSNDGKWMAIGGRDSLFRLLHTSTGTNRFEPIRLDGWVEDYQFTPDDSHVAVSVFGQYTYIIQTKSGEVVRKLPHSDSCRGLSFSPDGNLLAVGTGGDLSAPVGDIYLWDWKTGKAALPPLPARGGVDKVIFSPDGALLASLTLQTGAGAVQVWDIASGAPLTDRIQTKFQGDMGRFSPDGTQFIAAFLTGQVLLIDLPPRTTPMPGWLSSLAQGVGGKRISSAGGMGDVQRASLETVRESMANAPRDSYTPWGEWILADPETRNLSPRSNMSFQDYVTRLRRSNNRNDLRALLKLYPNDALVHARLGLILHNDIQQAGDEASKKRLWEHSALWYSRRAVDLEPSNPEVWSLRAELLQKAGLLAEAGQAALKVMQLDPSQADPENPNAWYFKALKLAEEGNWPEADAAFEKALTLIKDPSYDSAGQSMLAELLTYLQPFLAPGGFQNLQLPEPIPGSYEDFDATPEGALPAGWQALHHSDSDYATNHVHDLNNFRSDAFQNWVTLSFERALDLGPTNNLLGSRIQMSSSYLQVNGRRPQPFIKGHFLHAQSQTRRGNQIQYLTTPDVDCSDRKNVHAVFHSVYRQHPRSLAGIEYSVDAGETWHPARYWVDQANLVRAEDGHIDAQATFARQNSDLPWFINSSGQMDGGSYGYFFAAQGEPDPFLEGRSPAQDFNRIEVLRLPNADGQKSVRLRFVHAGMHSQFWSIDQIGLYELGMEEEEDTRYISVINDPARLAGLGTHIFLEKPVRPSGDHSLNHPELMEIKGQLPDVNATPSDAPTTGLAQRHARLLLNRAKALAPNDPWILLMWASVAARDGNLDEAWSAAYQALDLDPGSRLWVSPFVYLYTLQGDAYRHADNKDAAALCYETALALSRELLHESNQTLSERFEALGLKGEDAILLARESVWKYFDKGRLPDPDWTSPDYDDVTWKQGKARLGISDGAVTEVVAGSDNNRHTAIYFRKEFEVDPTHAPDRLLFSLTRDDGVVVYLNGHEIIRDNMPPGPIDYQTFAADTASTSDETTFFDFETTAEFIKPGRNVLAAEVHQINRTSSDLGFDLELNGTFGFKQILSPTQSWSLEMSLEMKPEIRTVLWLSRARSHRLRGELDEAFQALNQTRKLTPELPAMFVEEAILLKLRGQDDEAYVTWKKTVSLTASLKQIPGRWQNLALLPEWRFFESVHNPSAEYFAHLAGRFNPAGEPTTAFIYQCLMRLSQEQGSDDPATILARVNARRITGDYDLALEELEDFLAAGSPPASAAPVDHRLYRDGLLLKEQILRAQGDTQGAQAILPLIQAFPARSPDLSPKHIDLTEHYNVSLYDARGWRSRGRQPHLGLLPEQLGPVGGVTYDVRGIVQLDSGIYEGQGVAANERGKSFSDLSQKRYPVRVDGIRVDQQVNTMHFITSCRTAQGTNLTTVASLAIHYEDGNPELVDLEFNKNIGDWDFVMGTPVNIENIASRIIDQRPNNRNDRVTWHLAWKNPHPDRKVSHFDFISGRQNIAPYLIAVTVE